jgi:hypothetical protein
MNLESYTKILSVIKDTDKVVDIGGWERPFNRADYVIDVMPYETRKAKRGFPKEIPEHYTKDTWLNVDITKDPLPFKDKEIDFIICGHVLEDIKDPVPLCKEMMRVSKAGYIECPSRAIEMNTNIDPYMGSNRYVGYCHHRWFVEAENNTITFTPKWLVHSAVRTLRVKKVDSATVAFFWNDSFEIKETFFSSFQECVDNGLAFKARNDGKSLESLYTAYKMEKLFFKPLSQIRSMIKRKRLGFKHL